MFHLILKHRKKIFLILPCCLLVILISFLSGNAFWSSLHAESSDRQFRTFTRSLFQTEVSANTISLHYTYLALLKETPSYFDSVIRFEQKKAASGLFMPDYQADSVLDTCQSFIDMGKENYLVSTFNERIASLDLLPENKKDSFQKENMKLVTEEIYPAYQNLITAIKSLKGKGMNEQGLSHFPYGKKYYEYLVRQTTGCNESISRLRLMTRAQILEDLSATQHLPRHLFWSRHLLIPCWTISGPKSQIHSRKFLMLISRSNMFRNPCRII